QRYEAKIIALVLMSNHLHMLLLTPKSNLDEIMCYFLREVSRTIGRKSSRTNHIFGGPYKWCLIKQESHLVNAYKYVYRNPIAAGITNNVESYQFSSIHYLAYGYSLPFRVYDEYVVDSVNLPQPMKTRLTWLNTAF